MLKRKEDGANVLLYCDNMEGEVVIPVPAMLLVVKRFNTCFFNGQIFCPLLPPVSATIRYFSLLFFAFRPFFKRRARQRGLHQVSPTSTNTPRVFCSVHLRNFPGYFSKTPATWPHYKVPRGTVSFVQTGNLW